MNKPHDSKEIFPLLIALKNDLKDLAMWSVYNEDKYSDQIQEMRDNLDDIMYLATWPERNIAAYQKKIGAMRKVLFEVPEKKV